MPTDTSLKVIQERENEVYSIRASQQEINISGWKGGREYIDERLTRFPAESDADWDGGTRKGGSAFSGRREQAHLIPYLNRIVTKINQHVFGIVPKRSGIPTEIKEDISAEGKSLDDLMVKVNSYITTCGWAWIGIDAPVIGVDTEISQEQKEDLKIRPYWKAYSPLSIIDWHFNLTGELEWLIEEGYTYVGDDPFVPPMNVRYRKLWQKGSVTVYTYKDGKDEIESEEVIELSLKDTVPFVLVGEISAEAWAFDSLESINRTIMDLESCNRQNFYNSVFPQLVVPVSIMDNVRQQYSLEGEDAIQAVQGYNYPILVGENDKDPSYLMPDSASIGVMRTELNSLRKELFDSTGLMLQKDTAMAESAAAKAWDFLDVQAVMRERAKMLQDAEAKAVAISNEWDAEFPTWEPEYNTDFEIGDFKEEMEALILASNISMPDEMYKFIAKRVFELMKINGKSLSEEEEAILLASIENFEAIGMEAIDAELVEEVIESV